MLIRWLADGMTDFSPARNCFVPCNDAFIKPLIIKELSLYLLNNFIGHEKKIFSNTTSANLFQYFPRANNNSKINDH